MDLSTRYLGLDLPHPFMPGASPLARDLDTVRRLEDAGAAAIVMNSLFEEQVQYEQEAAAHFVDTPAYSFAEAQTYLPEPEPLSFGPEEYLQHVFRVAEAVDIPVIGSLNGTTTGRWLEYARLIEQAGAAALELNVYDLPTDPSTSASEIESGTVSLVREVKGSISIPLTVKLSPFYTAPVHFARSLEAAGAEGLVIFNRFYQPDIDPEELEVSRMLHLSTSNDLLLRLRWLAILSPQVDIDLAVTGGVHTAIDAVKAIMTGADVVQMTSSLLEKGPEYLAMVRRGLATWLIEHDYESLGQARGSMNLHRSPDPAGYERANYMDLLQSWKPEA